MMRRILGGKMGYDRKNFTREGHNLCSSPSMRIIKSRRMRWAEYIASMEVIRNVYGV